MAETLDEDDLQQLYTWIDDIPLSRPKRNITRDFSDGVLVAEIIHHFLPKHIDLHNYTAVNSTSQKSDNWNLLNRKVLSKIGHQITKEHIANIVSNKQGTIELVLHDLRIQIEAYEARRIAEEEAERLAADSLGDPLGYDEYADQAGSNYNSPAVAAYDNYQNNAFTNGMDNNGLGPGPPVAYHDPYQQQAAYHSQFTGAPHPQQHPLQLQQQAHHQQQQQQQAQQQQFVYQSQPHPIAEMQPAADHISPKQAKQKAVGAAYGKNKPAAKKAGPANPPASSTASGSMESTDALAGRLALEEKEQSLLASQETVQILQAKIRRLEHLLHLKDLRIADLTGKLQTGGGGAQPPPPHNTSPRTLPPAQNFHHHHPATHPPAGRAGVAPQFQPRPPLPGIPRPGVVDAYQR